MFGRPGKIDSPDIIFIVSRDNFYILNIIINKVGSKKTYLEIDSSMDAFPGMTRYQPVYTMESIHDKP